ncbi:hypothetical protein PCANC_27773, partial [Puccinia coronata f. sp. avenae]
QQDDVANCHLHQSPLTELGIYIDTNHGKGRDYYLWESHCVCQAHLNAQARGLDMPTWAAPDVKAAWNAVRNRLGRGPIQFDGPSPEEIVWNYGREPTRGNTIKAMVTRR